MGSLDVLIGVNGAGLVNGLFLPPHAVAMQIIPWNSKLNHEEFARVLRSRGPYAEWTNAWKEVRRHASATRRQQLGSPSRGVHHKQDA